jgi:hypothetical protein
MYGVTLMKKLTKAQKEIWDLIKTNDWFDANDISPYIRNKISQCHKMYEKDYLDAKLINNATEWRFRKKVTK